MARKRILTQLKTIRVRLFGVLWRSLATTPFCIAGRATLARNDDEQEEPLFVIPANAGIQAGIDSDLAGNH